MKGRKKREAKCLNRVAHEAFRKLLHNGSDPLQIQFNIERAHPTGCAPRGLKPHVRFSINSRARERERNERERRKFRVTCVSPANTGKSLQTVQ